MCKPITEVFRQGLWMRHYGSESCKHTFLWSNSSGVRHLSMGRLTKDRAAILWYDYPNIYQLDSCGNYTGGLPKAHSSQSLCLRTGAAPNCSALGHQEHWPEWETPGDWSEEEVEKISEPLQWFGYHDSWDFENCYCLWSTILWRKDL